MSAIDLLTTRRSVLARNMAEPGPSEDELQQILVAGTRVPDHGKLGPWRIQILNKDAQRQLGEVVAKRFVEVQGERANEKMVEFERDRPQRAPVLLVVTSKLTVPHNIPELEQRLSGGAVCMNLLNAAHALGYGAQWLSEWIAYDDEIKTTLGHDADTDIIGFIYIGTPTEPPKERTRPDLTDVVSEWTGA